MSSAHEIIASHDERDMLLEKKDSKESNSTVTSDTLITRSASYNQADHIAASNVNSVIEVDPLQRANTLPENLLQNININSESTTTDTLQSEMKEEDVQDLASFLIRRACKNSSLANYFYWYLLIECEDQEHTIKQDVRNIFTTVLEIYVFLF